MEETTVPSKNEYREMSIPTEAIQCNLLLNFRPRWFMHLGKYIWFEVVHKIYKFLGRCQIEINSHMVFVEGVRIQNRHGIRITEMVI